MSRVKFPDPWLMKTANPPDPEFEQISGSPSPLTSPTWISAAPVGDEYSAVLAKEPSPSVVRQADCRL